MTTRLTDRLREALDRETGQTIELLEVEAGGWKVTLGAAHVESLAVSAIQLRVEASAARVGISDARPERPVQVSDAAQRLANTATYLTEPLTVMEVDRLADEALVRSQRPEAAESDSDFRRYFEVRMTGDAAQLARYETNAAGRARIEFRLTRDVIERLVGDFVIALTPAATEERRFGGFRVV